MLRAVLLFHLLAIICLLVSGVDVASSSVSSAPPSSAYEYASVVVASSSVSSS